jgi:hypothetical protein
LGIGCELERSFLVVTVWTPVGAFLFAAPSKISVFSVFWSVCSLVSSGLLDDLGLSAMETESDVTVMIVIAEDDDINEQVVGEFEDKAALEKSERVVEDAVSETLRGSDVDDDDGQNSVIE